MNNIERAKRRVLEKLESLHVARKKLSKFKTKKPLGEMTNAERRVPMKYQDLKKAQDALRLADNQFRQAVKEYSETIRKHNGR